MKSFIQFLGGFFLMAMLLGVSLGANYLYAGWVAPPSGTPPTNCVTGISGCDTPLNTSTVGQIKQGVLDIGPATGSSSLAFIARGRARVEGWMRVGSSNTAAPAAPIDLTGNATSDGILFADGTEQTTAFLGASNYIDTSSTGQTKTGSLFVGNIVVPTTTRMFVTRGAGNFVGWLTVGVSDQPTALLDLRGVAGTDGIRFPDGTTQTTAFLGGGSYIDTSSTGQTKAGNLIVGTYTANATRVFNANGGANVRGWLTVGGTVNPTALLDLSNGGAGNGIKFPDGTTQTTAFLGGGSYIDTSATAQTKAGNLSLSNNLTADGTTILGTYVSPSARSLVVRGATGIQGRLIVGVAGTDPTALLDLRGAAGTDGIKFPDGTIQTTAYTGASGSYIDTSATAQTKTGDLILGTFVSNANRTLVAKGAGSFQGWLAVGGNAVPTALLDLSNGGAGNGIKFPDGTTQTTAYVPPATPKANLSNVRTYTSSGTWSKPANLAYVEVEVWGGGGAGAVYGGSAGANGGDSCFGGCASPLLRANGGAGSGSGGIGGAGGTASGGTINISGGRGGAPNAVDAAISSSGGDGGDSPRGGAGGAGGYGSTSCCTAARSTGRPGETPGGGGGGAGDYHSAGLPAGGGGGGYSYEYIPAASLGASVTVTVGAGGLGGTNANGNAGSGAPGMIVVKEYTY